MGVTYRPAVVLPSVREVVIINGEEVGTVWAEGDGFQANLTVADRLSIHYFSLHGMGDTKEAAILAACGHGAETANRMRNMVNLVSESLRDVG